MEKTITFVDAQEMMKNHPDTFEAPTKNELDNLKVDDSVKVCVENKERFWVTVKEINGDQIKGEVDNQLIEINLELGEEIEFEKRHIYSIWE